MRLFDADQVVHYRRLLAERDFRRWFWSSLWSSFGDWVGVFALQVLVVSLADAGSRLALFGLGGIMMARLLPSVVVGPLAGVVADRFDRKRLMLAADLSRAVLFAGIAFSRDIWLIFALTIAVETLSLLYLSAKNAALPELVDREDLTEANQLTLLITYGPLPFGAAAAAFMAWLTGALGDLGLPDVDPTTAALLLNALTFLLAGTLLVRMRAIAGSRSGGRADDDSASSALAEVRDGLRFIARRRLVRPLITGVIAVFFGAGVVIALGPEFVRADLGRPEGDWYGLMTWVGFGLLAGILASPIAAARFDQRRLFPVALTATSAAAMSLSFVTAFWLVEAGGALLGAVAGLTFVTGYTLLHEQTEDAVRARTFAAFYTGTRISMFAALGLGPFLAGAIGRFTIAIGPLEQSVSGVRVVIAFGGLVALAGAVAALRGMWSTVDEEEAEEAQGKAADEPEGTGSP